MTSPSTPRLVLASHNRKKLAELRAILVPLIPQLDPASIVSASDVGVTDEPVEDGVTFTQNAFIKARAVHDATGLCAVADDSGLSVDVLGGAPGIFSARWCGHHGDDQANLDLLLHQLADVHDEHRQAAFVCAAVLVCPNGVEKSVIGEMQGRLIREPIGDGGFGYDPIFVPDGYNVTTAQMSPEDKNSISHRGRALRALAPFIASALGYPMTEIRR